MSPIIGSLTDETATNGRYVLACPQTEGEKTVKFTITRPPDFTRFGAEWVQLFPKDSWTNVTNEYEPFTFNAYGDLAFQCCLSSSGQNRVQLAKKALRLPLNSESK